MRPEPEVLTYEPDSSLRKGYLAIFSEICSELKRNRWLIYQLFKRDFFSSYKQSLAGWLWVLFAPLFSVGTFFVLNRSGIFSTGQIEVPYLLYALLGISTWNLFSAGLIAGCNALVRAGDLIVKINFSKKSLVIASLGQACVSFVVQLALLGALFIYYGMTPSSGALFLPLILLPLLSLTLAAGLILSLANSLLRDIGTVIPMVLTFLMFLTPVLYSRPQAGALASLTTYNPMYYFVDSGRDLVLFGTIREPAGLTASALFSLVALVICLLVFHLTETRIAERI